MAEWKLCRLRAGAARRPQRGGAQRGEDSAEINATVGAPSARDNPCARLERVRGSSGGTWEFLG